MLRNLSFSILIISILFIFGCGSSDPGSGFSEEDQLLMLTNTGDNIIIPAYLELKNESQDLADKIAALTTTLNSDNLTAVKTQLKVTRLAWQNCNMYDFGPASTNGLAAILNVFPVDVNIIESNIENGNFSIEALASNKARGFQAIAYILYGESKSEAEILTSLETENRKQYLKVLADKIAEKSNTVYNAWISAGENYVATFNTKTGTDVGSSLGIMLNAIIQSLERKTRDGKIGIPAGLRTLGIPVPESIESIYGGYSVELLNANLKAYSDLFEGITSNNVDEEGILDYLNKVDESGLRASISSQLESTLLAASTINEPLQEEVVTNVTASNNTIAEIQKLLIFLKTDMTSKLGVSITYQDNDGD